MEDIGIEPMTFRMQSGRSTNWAKPPFLCLKYRMPSYVTILSKSLWVQVLLAYVIFYCLGISPNVRTFLSLVSTIATYIINTTINLHTYLRISEVLLWLLSFLRTYVHRMELRRYVRIYVRTYLPPFIMPGAVLLDWSRVRSVAGRQRSTSLTA